MWCKRPCMGLGIYWLWARRRCYLYAPTAIVVRLVKDGLRLVFVKAFDIFIEVNVLRPTGSSGSHWRVHLSFQACAHSSAMSMHAVLFFSCPMQCRPAFVSMSFCLVGSDGFVKVFSPCRHTMSFSRYCMLRVLPYLC